MKCEEYQAIIEEYIDGELDRQTALSVSDHLTVCLECADFCDSLRREQQIYAHYNRDVEVTPALWMAVQERIQIHKAENQPDQVSPLRERKTKAIILSLFPKRFADLLSTPRFSPALATALVLITVAATIVVMSYLQSNQPDTGKSAIATDNSNTAPSQTLAGNVNKNEGAKDDREEIAVSDTTPESEKTASAEAAPRPRRAVKREPTPEQLIREAEQKYLAAIAILARDVNRRRSQIDPMIVAQFDAALADIDHTIAETKRAARQNPEDPIALQYMLTAYAKKVDVLREMARN